MGQNGLGGRGKQDRCATSIQRQADWQIRPPRADSSLGKTNYQYSLFARFSSAAKKLVRGLVNPTLRSGSKTAQSLAFCPESRWIWVPPASRLRTASAPPG